jgi:CRISPR type I-D-associated protein Csc2
MLNLSLEEMKVTKTIFIVAYKALQPLMLRTEGIYDTSTRLAGETEVPSIITRKMIRPLRDTLRSVARTMSDGWINTCSFPTEEMCCYCIDCLIFGGTNAKAGNPKKVNEKKFKFKTRMVQLRSLVHPSDALLVSEDQKGAIESETHVGVKEGRWANIGQALYSPFQIPAGSKFIGTFMLDFDKTKVDQDNLVNVFATIFVRTRRYGGRTAQEGLVEPQILAVIEAPYECISSYDLYPIVKKEKENWSTAVQTYLEQLILTQVNGAKIIKPQILQETELLVAIEALTTGFREELKQEGIEVQEVK